MDLACSFKVLSIVNLTEEGQHSTSKTTDLQPFEYPSGPPSLTTLEEEAEVPELVAYEDEEVPMPGALLNDQQDIEEGIWALPTELGEAHTNKRPYSSVSPDSEVETQM